MIYTTIKPHPKLSSYIDTYWKIEGGQNVEEQSILPDGCVDLVINLGENCFIADGRLTMETGKAYLVGTMTVSQNSFIGSGNSLIGIRFRPAAFSSFYNYASLNEIKDLTVEFDRTLSPEFHKVEEQFTSYLNSYFLNRLTTTNHNLYNVLRDVQSSKGTMRVETLAERNFTTERQLERSFKKYIGISPKEFSNVVRFRSALSKLKDNKQACSLLEIAVDCGYYDHTHLTKQIKRYTGLSPSQF